MTLPAIQVNNVDFSYDKTLVLERIQLTIEPGEFIGIFGPNGGGKTTLLKLLIGLLTPGRGEIRLFGKSLRHARQAIGYVPQSIPANMLFC